MAKPEVYVSLDIEADGPVPGLNNMLSLGAAVIDRHETVLDRFSVNLKLLPEASPHPDTMDWWATQPDAWAACRSDPQEPDEAMQAFDTWLASATTYGKLVPMGYPAAYDFMWVNWYLVRFVGHCRLGFSCLDLKSFAMAHLKLDYRSAAKKRFPKDWFGETAHSHIAVEDAIEQGIMGVRMMRAAGVFGEQSTPSSRSLGTALDLRPGHYWARPKPGTELYRRDKAFGLPIGYEVVQVFADVKGTLFIAIPGESNLFNPEDFEWGRRVTLDVEEGNGPEGVE